MQSNEFKLNLSENRSSLIPLEEAIIKRDLKSIEKHLACNQINMDIDLVNDALKMLKERLEYNENDSLMCYETRIIFDMFNRPNIQYLFATHEIKKHNIQEAVGIVLKINGGKTEGLLDHVNYLSQFCCADTEKSQLITEVAACSNLFSEAIKKNDRGILKVLLDSDARLVAPAIKLLVGSKNDTSKNLLWLLNQYANDISSPQSLLIRGEVLESAIKGGNAANVSIIYYHFRTKFTPSEKHLLRVSPVAELRRFYCADLIEKYIAYESGKMNGSCMLFKTYKPIDKINTAHILNDLLDAKEIDCIALKAKHPILKVSNKLGEILRAINSAKRIRPGF